MKKKSGFLGTIAAATLAVAGGLASSPTGQQNPYLPTGGGLRLFSGGGYFSKGIRNLASHDWQGQTEQAQA